MSEEEKFGYVVMVKGDPSTGEYFDALEEAMDWMEEGMVVKKGRTARIWWYVYGDGKSGREADALFEYMSQRPRLIDIIEQHWDGWMDRVEKRLLSRDYFSGLIEEAISHAFFDLGVGEDIGDKMDMRVAIRLDHEIEKAIERERKRYSGAIAFLQDYREQLRMYPNGDGYSPRHGMVASLSVKRGRYDGSVYTLCGFFRSFDDDKEIEFDVDLSGDEVAFLVHKIDLWVELIRRA
jgi:uncharacterized protein YneR